MQKNKSSPILPTVYKINSKKTKNLKVRSEIVKLIEEHLEGEAHNIGLGKYFFKPQTQK
jgi:hypothetical protein